MNQSQDVSKMNKTVPQFIKERTDYLQRYNQELLDIQKLQQNKKLYELQANKELSILQQQKNSN